MTKRDDDLHNAADRKIVANVTPLTPGAEPEQVHRIPGRVTRAELAVIIRAVTLFLANNADLDDDTAEKTGKALTEICRLYLLHERSMRHANQAAPRAGGESPTLNQDKTST